MIGLFHFRNSPYFEWKMEKFTWVGPFEKISKWLLEYENNQTTLVQYLIDIGIGKAVMDYESIKNKEKGITIPLREIDPFTFLAVILKYSAQRTDLLAKLDKITNIGINIPRDYSGVPNVDTRKAWLFSYEFERNKNDVQILWDLFKAIHTQQELEILFNQALNIRQVALPKLTEMLFLLFPRKFFPVDGVTDGWLKDRGITLSKDKIRWTEYKSITDLIKKNIRSDFFEISHYTYLITQYIKYGLDVDALDELLALRYERITPGVDYLKGFKNKRDLQLAIDTRTGDEKFNLVFDARLPVELGIKSSFKVFGNANAKTNAPKLFNKEVSLVNYKNLDGYKLLRILDWYDGSIVMLIPSDPNNDSEFATRESQMHSFPSNQILYGPPGTGKTYATTELAVQIADPEWYASFPEKDTIEHHKAIKEKYDELIQKNQIAFTTFHQSFSYEDFIEGLKAYVPEGQTNIAYKVEDGIFKQIAVQAQKAEGINKSDVLGLNDAPKIWKIALGETGDVERRKSYFENSEIRIGWNPTGNLLKERSRDQLEYLDSLGPNDQASLYYFIEEMKVGDVVLCLRNRKSIQAIGVISSDYYFDEQAYESDSDFAHVRKVKWLATGINFNILALNHNFQLGIKSVYELSRISWVQLVEELKVQDIIIEEIHNPKKLITNSVNHVLIMDEINRGNISKIFGELITLIEDDKRAGKSDARELTLPYSKEPFTVPSNLYLIGTMNTADKSLTQLDLALRRRFEFKEIGPDNHILEDMEASQHDVDIPLMLKKMNQRIQYLKGKDYQIGHSYFMPLCSEMDQADYLQTLRRIFKNKIIPLLQEYFFSNLKHIGLVLNDNPDDMDERKIIQDLNFDENIFGYGQQLKGNPLFAVELNLDCFSDLKRFQQIYQ